MKPKTWQIVVIALAFIAVGASAAYMLTRSGPNLPTKITLIDVSTGQLYEWNKKKYRVALPAPEPSSGEYRLVPVMKGEEGKWLLTPSGRSMLRDITSAIRAVDSSSGEVVEASADVKRYIPPGAE